MVKIVQTQLSIPMIANDQIDHQDQGAPCAPQNNDLPPEEDRKKRRKQQLLNAAITIIAIILLLLIIAYDCDWKIL